MKLTVGRLLDSIIDHEEITDDFEVYIEYPKRYGLGRIDGKEVDITKLSDDSDMIYSTSIGVDLTNKRLYIYHHY